MRSISRSPSRDYYSRSRSRSWSSDDRSRRSSSRSRSRSYSSDRSRGRDAGSYRGFKQWRGRGRGRGDFYQNRGGFRGRGHRGGYMGNNFIPNFRGYNNPNNDKYLHHKGRGKYQKNDYDSDDNSKGRSNRSRSRSRSASSKYSSESSKNKKKSNEPSRCVCIFGLSPITKERNLFDCFKHYGWIMEIQIIYNHFNYQSKGYAFIYFREIGAAIMCYECAPGMHIDNRSIRTEYSPRGDEQRPVSKSELKHLRSRDNGKQKFLELRWHSGMNTFHIMPKDAMHHMYTGHAPHLKQYNHNPNHSKRRPRSISRSRSRSKSRSSSRDRSRSRTRNKDRSRSSSRDPSRSPSRNRSRKRSRSRSPSPMRKRSRSKNASRHSSRKSRSRSRTISTSPRHPDFQEDEQCDGKSIIPSSSQSVISSANPQETSPAISPSTSRTISPAISPSTSHTILPSTPSVILPTTPSASPQADRSVIPEVKPSIPPIAAPTRPPLSPIRVTMYDDDKVEGDCRENEVIKYGGVDIFSGHANNISTFKYGGGDIQIIPTSGNSIIKTESSDNTINSSHDKLIKSMSHNSTLSKEGNISQIVNTNNSNPTTSQMNGSLMNAVNNISIHNGISNMSQISSSGGNGAFSVIGHNGISAYTHLTDNVGNRANSVNVNVNQMNSNLGNISNSQTGNQRIINNNNMHMQGSVPLGGISNLWIGYPNNCAKTNVVGAVVGQPRLNGLNNNNANTSGIGVLNNTPITIGADRNGYGHINNGLMTNNYAKNINNMNYTGVNNHIYPQNVIANNINSQNIAMRNLQANTSIISQHNVPSNNTNISLSSVASPIVCATTGVGQVDLKEDVENVIAKSSSDNNIGINIMSGDGKEHLDAACMPILSKSSEFNNGDGKKSVTLSDADQTSSAVSDKIADNLPSKNERLGGLVNTVESGGFTKKAYSNKNSKDTRKNIIMNISSKNSLTKNIKTNAQDGSMKSINEQMDNCDITANKCKVTSNSTVDSVTPNLGKKQSKDNGISDKIVIKKETREKTETESKVEIKIEKNNIADDDSNIDIPCNKDIVKTKSSQSLGRIREHSSKDEIIKINPIIKTKVRNVDNLNNVSSISKSMSEIKFEDDKCGIEHASSKSIVKKCNPDTRAKEKFSEKVPRHSDIKSLKTKSSRVDKKITPRPSVKLASTTIPGDDSMDEEGDVSCTANTTHTSPQMLMIHSSAKERYTSQYSNYSDSSSNRSTSSYSSRSSRTSRDSRLSRRSRHSYNSTDSYYSRSSSRSPSPRKYHYKKSKKSKKSSRKSSKKSKISKRKRKHSCHKVSPSGKDGKHSGKRMRCTGTPELDFQANEHKRSGKSKKRSKRQSEDNDSKIQKQKLNSSQNSKSPKSKKSKANISLRKSEPTRSRSRVQQLSSNPEFDLSKPFHLSKLNIAKFHVSQKLRKRKAQLISNNNWNNAKPGQWVQKGVCRAIPEVSPKGEIPQVTNYPESPNIDELFGYSNLLDDEMKREKELYERRLATAKKNGKLSASFKEISKGHE